MVNIRLVTIGRNISNFDIEKIIKWKSEVYTIVYTQPHDISAGADLSSWGYSDKLLEEILPSNDALQNSSQHRDTPIDITIFVIDAPLYNNYFSRTLTGNRIVVSYYEIKDILQESNIPLENYLIRLLYAYSFIYMGKSGNDISMLDESYFAHDYYKGCIYDMCGNKRDIVYSVINPIICDECKVKFRNKHIREDLIVKAQKEIARLNKRCSFRIQDYFQNHPIIKNVIHIVGTIIISIISSYCCYLLFGND